MKVDESAGGHSIAYANQMKEIMWNEVIGRKRAALLRRLSSVFHYDFDALRCLPLLKLPLGGHTQGVLANRRARTMGKNAGQRRSDMRYIKSTHAALSSIGRDRCGATIGRLETCLGRSRWHLLHIAECCCIFPQPGIL